MTLGFLRGRDLDPDHELAVARDLGEPDHPREGRRALGVEGELGLGLGIGEERGPELRADLGGALRAALVARAAELLLDPTQLGLARGAVLRDRLLPLDPRLLGEIVLAIVLAIVPTVLAVVLASIALISR